MNERNGAQGKNEAEYLLPKAFLDRMERMLGEEYEAFRRAFQEDAPVRGVRINPLKVTDGTRMANSLGLSPIPYTTDGYYVDDTLSGTHPLHQAGALYFQDPGAMSTVAAAKPKPDWFVLDLSAAPGGKSAQLAAAIGEGGFLLSNEPIASRCRILTGQMERLGVRNAVVTNVMPAVLASWYPHYFDFVLADVPCSGEGMFRKSAEAREEWSEARVTMCALRQKEIMEAACGCVREGGYLLYSTCTFSIEENEGMIADFLARHGEFSLCPVGDEVRAVTADGVTDGFSPTLSLARRFYPHVTAGEGQFMALLKKEGDGQRHTPRFSPVGDKLSKEEEKAVSSFLDDVLFEALPYPVKKRGERLEIVPPQLAVPPFGCFSAGVTLGTVQKGRVVPHHAFFSAYGQKFRRQLALTTEDVRTYAYLRGETVAAEELTDGWAAVTVDGCPLGGGKVVSGVLKNHYPKGLRLP